jgi:UPF0271 protein
MRRTMRVDLNADVGESFGVYRLGDDAALLPYVSSANIACGFHGGDPHVMRKTVQVAVGLGLALGAHPGYPDLAGFGRRPLPLTQAEIEDVVVYQIGAVAAMATACGGALRHVKPHGALYNVAADDASAASAVSRAIRSVNPELILVGRAGSKLVAAGREIGLRTASEVFADRGYDPEGRLLPRGTPGALLEDAAAVAARAVWMVTHQAIPTADGRELPMVVDTICIHGDTPNAVAHARAVREALLAAGVRIGAPA